MPPSLSALASKMGQLFSLISGRIDDKLDKTAAAQSALKLHTPFTLTLQGGCNGSAQINGAGDVTLTTSLDVIIPPALSTTVLHETLITLMPGGHQEFPIGTNFGHPIESIRVEVKVRNTDVNSPLNNGFINAEGVASWGIRPQDSQAVVINHSTETLEFWVYITSDPRNP